MTFPVPIVKYHTPRPMEPEQYDDTVALTDDPNSLGPFTVNASASEHSELEGRL